MAYEALRRFVEESGGMMRHVKKNVPPGGAWVIVMGDKVGVFLPGGEEGEWYPPLDALYNGEFLRPDFAEDLIKLLTQTYPL